MQILARESVDGQKLSDDDVRAILTAPLRDASVYGAELLDLAGTSLGDLSARRPGVLDDGTLGQAGDLIGCTITHDSTLPAPTTCRIQTVRELDWSTVRIRPWQQISADGAAVRFSLGLYGLETPTQSAAEGVFDVQGYDMLAGLRVGITDTIVVDTTTPYLAAARGLLDGMDIPGLKHQIAHDADDVLPARAQVFALSTNNTDLVLDCINDLLAAVGYTPLMMNELGVLVSVPLIAPDKRPSVWTFDLNEQTGPKTSIVDVARSKKVDGIRQTNWWRFVRRGMASAPAEGAGWYTPRPKPAGRVVPYFETVDVASQAALVAYGDARVVADTTRTTTLSMTSESLPPLDLGLPDIVTISDLVTGIDGRAQITQWAHDLAQAETTMTAGVL